MFQHLSEADFESVRYAKLELEFDEARAKLAQAIAEEDQTKLYGSEDEEHIRAKAEVGTAKKKYLQLARALGKKDASTQNKPVRALLAEQVPAGVPRSEGVKKFYVKWMQRKGREPLPTNREERAKVVKKLQLNPFGNHRYYPVPADAASQFRDDVYNWLGVRIDEDGLTEDGTSLLTFALEELTDPSGRMHKNRLSIFHQFTGGTLNKVLKHLSTACHRDDCDVTFVGCDAVELTKAEWDHKILRMIAMGELEKGSTSKGTCMSIADLVNSRNKTPEDFVKNFMFCECTCSECHTAAPCMEY